MMHYMSVILCKCTMCCFHNLETPNSTTASFDGCMESWIGTVYTRTTAKRQLLEKVYAPGLFPEAIQSLGIHTQAWLGMIQAARELPWSTTVWRSAASWEPKLILNCYTAGYKPRRPACWHRHRSPDLRAARSTSFSPSLRAFSFSLCRLLDFLVLLSTFPRSSCLFSASFSTPSLYFSSTFSFSLLHSYFSVFFPASPFLSFCLSLLHSLLFVSPLHPFSFRCVQKKCSVHLSFSLLIPLFFPLALFFSLFFFY